MKKISYVGNFSKSMKDYTEEKIKKISDLFDFETARVISKPLSNKNFKVELSVDNSFRATAEGTDFYYILLDAIDKILKQVKKNKRYITEKRGKKINIIGLEDFEEVEKISKEKFLILSDMSLEEAIREMELLDHNFYIFKDIDHNSEVAVIYRRDNGEIGIIRCR